MSPRGDRRYLLLARVPWPRFTRRPLAPPVPMSRLQDALGSPSDPPTDTAPVSARPRVRPAQPVPRAPVTGSAGSGPEPRSIPAAAEPPGTPATAEPATTTTPATTQTASEPAATTKPAATKSTAKTAVKRTVVKTTVVKTSAAKKTPAEQAAPEKTPPDKTVRANAVDQPAGALRSVPIPLPVTASAATVDVTPGADAPAPAARAAVTAGRAANEEARFWSPDRVEHPRWVSRRSFLAVAVAVVLAGMGITFAGSRQDEGPRGTQVLGVPLSIPQADAAPQTSTASVSMADGQVVVTETWVWPGAIPPTIDVRQPDLRGLVGIPSGTRVTASRPDASVDGDPLIVTAAGDGSWRLAVPTGVGHGVVLVRYRLSGTVHTDPRSPPERALAVVALAPQTSSAGVPRQLILPAANVLNVSCPSASGGPVVLCATRRVSSWVVTLPPGGSVALAQLNLGS